MEVYKTRYAADKVRKTSPWHSCIEKIIKVSGGYTLMTPDEYEKWKKQK